MAYYLGIDLGTTYTAAAVWRDGRVEMANLGTRAAVVPSVVLLRDDGTILTGEAAERRAVTEPLRVAREFKRRVGDPTPIIVGGTPYSADALTARLLRWVVSAVVEREGEPPAGVVVSHPANWGPFKQDLLGQAMRQADLSGASTITEPEAAAIHYASQARVEPGAVVAVYDLGGGTFDAAVLRRGATGWEILGEPEGIERLGGIDFDQAVFHHVQATVGEAIEALDPDDPAAVAALARLRRECVEAKEALATDVDVVIPVLLPTIQTDVRLTRSEFEAMIRPTLIDSIDALRRALRSASVGPDDVATVLLVGGSSRIPLVAQLVGSELGRPVAVDAHPKHGVALGAAIIAAEQGTGGRVDTEVVPAIDAVPPPLPVEPEPVPVVPVVPVVAAALPPPPVAAAVPPPPPTPVSPPAPPVEPPRPPAGEERGRRTGLLVASAVLAVACVVGIALVLSSGGDDDDDPAVASAAPDTTTTSSTSTTTTTSAPPPGPSIAIDAVRVEGDSYRVDYTIYGYVPDQADPEALHTHFFLDTTTSANAGTNGSPPGDWYLTYESGSVLTDYGPADRGSATQMCSVVADSGHGVVDPASGNCVPLPY